MNTWSQGTGPSSDHTYGTSAGKYMYFEASNKAKGMKARLLSPPATVIDRNSCISFWYHMYGPHTGDLSVYAKVWCVLQLPLLLRIILTCSSIHWCPAVL